MKKTLAAAALAVSLLLSGCSGVSQEDYNSLLEENTRLQEENSNLETHINELNSQNQALTSENDDISLRNESLLEEVDMLNSQIENLTALSSVETEEATNNTDELPLNEWLSYENTLNEMQDEYILGENPGDKWYYRGSGLFVTYIDDESYNNRADEDLITGAYAQMSLNVIAHPDNIVPLYIFEWVKKNGEIVANGFVTVDENENILHTLEWNGEYSYLNSHPKQLELFYTAP